MTADSGALSGLSVPQAILNGETANQIKVVYSPAEDGRADHWLIVVEYGWAETIVAECDYAHHAAGVALALDEALVCPEPILWPDEIHDALKGEADA